MKKWERILEVWMEGKWNVAAYSLIRRTKKRQGINLKDWCTEDYIEEDCVIFEKWLVLVIYSASLCVMNLNGKKSNNLIFLDHLIRWNKTDCHHSAKSFSCYTIKCLCDIISIIIFCIGASSLTSIPKPTLNILLLRRKWFYIALYSVFIWLNSL